MSQDCFLNSKDGKNCGSSRGLSGLVRLSECDDEVKHHLISCHLSKEVLSENELILARTGLFHLAQEHKQKMWICYRGEVLEKYQGNVSVSRSCWCQEAYPRQRCNYLAYVSGHSKAVWSYYSSWIR